MAEIKFEIVKHVGVLSTGNNGWSKEVNLVSWNGARPKYDIRSWDENHTRMSKGISLTEEEFKALENILHSPEDSIDIVFDEDGHEISAYDGRILVGGAELSLSEDAWNIESTMVKSDYVKKGVLKLMVAEILKQSQINGVRLTSSCPASKIILEEM